MKENAQVSLEYLLVLAAFFSAVALFVPLMDNVHQTAVFGLDVLRAKSFVESFEETVKEFSVFADGSKKQITAMPLNEWVVSANGKNFVLKVNNSKLLAEKTFSAALPNEIFLQEIVLQKETVFYLEKKDGRILVIVS